MDFLNVWRKVLTAPKEAFTEEKARANMRDGVVHLVVSYAVCGFLFGLLVYVSSLLFASASSYPSFTGFLGGLGLAALVISPILFIVLGLLGSFIGVGVLYVISKLLGGSGTASQQFYLYAIFSAPLMILIGLLSFVPFVGLIAFILLQLYSLYLLTLSLKEVHGFGTFKAVLVWLLPLFLVLVFVIFLVLVALLRPAF